MLFYFSFIFCYHAEEFIPVFVIAITKKSFTDLIVFEAKSKAPDY